MVSGKDAVASNYQIAVNAKKSTVSKSSKTPKKEDDFRSMLDKKVKNDTVKPQKSQKNEEKTEVSPKNEEVSTPVEEKALDNGMNVQVMTPYIVLPEQERVGLNWGQAVMEDVSVTGTEKATQIVPAEVAVDASAGKTVEIPKETAHVQTDVLKKTDVPEEVQTKETVKTENAVKQSDHTEVQKAKNESVQSTKETTVDSSRKAVENEDVLEGKEITWQKEAVKEEVISHEAIPKTKTEETLLKFKVGESVDMSGKNAVEDLADKILMRSVGKNNNAFEIQLKPQELGNIKIKLVFEHGRVNVAMFCENQKAAELLSASSTKLSEMIESRTGDQTNVFVEQKEDNPFRDGGQKENNHQNAQDQKKQHHDNKNDGELLDFVQQMRLGFAQVQSIT